MWSSGFSAGDVGQRLEPSLRSPIHRALYPVQSATAPIRLAAGSSVAREHQLSTALRRCSRFRCCSPRSVDSRQSPDRAPKRRRDPKHGFTASSNRPAQADRPRTELVPAHGTLPLSHRQTPGLPTARARSSSDPRMPDRCSRTNLVGLQGAKSVGSAATVLHDCCCAGETCRRCPPTRSAILRCPRVQQRLVIPRW